MLQRKQPPIEHFFKEKALSMGANCGGAAPRELKFLFEF